MKITVGVEERTMSWWEVKSGSRKGAWATFTQSSGSRRRHPGNIRTHTTRTYIRWKPHSGVLGKTTAVEETRQARSDGNDLRLEASPGSQVVTLRATDTAVDAKTRLDPD